MSKIYLIFFFYTLTLLHSFADEQTIWITPSETDYSRLSTGLAGSNITIIGEDEIKNSKNSSIPEIISSHSGIQLRNLFSNVNSTGSTLDLRGFGESAKNNSVILLNGRRLNDIDMAGVNFSMVPKDSIKRIEVIRGGSASTLYGNGAVGGAINIVTKNVTDTTSQLNAGIASHNSYSSDFSMPIIINKNSGVLLSASINESDTYRQRSDFESESYLIRYNIRENNNDYYLDINDSSYSQLLPGVRYKGNLNGVSDGYAVTCNLLSESRTAFQKGALHGYEGCLVRDPDYANFETIVITTGADLQINDLTDIHISLASRNKEQRAFIAAGASTLGNPTSADTFNLYDLETDYLSLRTDHKTFIGENLASLSVGVDFQDTDYSKKSSQSTTDPFGGFVYASQEGSAIYSQNSVNLTNGKSILSFGFRAENAQYKVNESFDTSVSKFAGSTARDPYQTKMNNTAANIGVEYILDSQNTLFFKYAEAFRTPDLDARNSTCADDYSACTGTGTFFYLADQTSDELEFGIRHVIENLSFTSSIYEMNTLNEIRYVPYANNTNLDPIKRKGLDLDFNYNLDEKTSIDGSFSYIDAHFTTGSLSRGSFKGTYAANSTTASERMDSSRNLSDGTYNIAGLKVPLVAEYAYNLGLDYKMTNNINLKLQMSFVDEMFVSNDQENIEPTIPSYYLFDLGFDAKNDYGVWSFGIDNIFNTSYYTFAVASSSHSDSSYGIQNMYPLERRSIFLDYSYEF